MFIRKSINQKEVIRGGDMYRAMIWQNRLLFFLVMTILLCSSSLYVAYTLKPIPVLLIDEQGRYVAKVEYLTELPLSPLQLESMVKRFIQYYLSQNSATIYEDAAIALAAMCPSLRTQTQREWVEGGRLARIVQRLQLSRVIFSNFSILKYVDTKDVQVLIKGKLLVSETQGTINETEFASELAFNLVPLSIRNYLGIEVCSIKFL